MKSRTKMLEISALVLVLQIGFNVGLNYRGFNYNPLLPSAHFLNHGQARRFYPYRYMSLPSSRSPASDSEQSESEETSLEDSSYRMSLDYNHPYLRQNDYLKYSTAADNSASLEMSPVGEIGLNNYAALYRSALYDRKRADADLRRSLLRDRLSGSRRAHNRKKSHRKEDVESTVETPVKEKPSRKVNSEPRLIIPLAEQPEESEYFQSLLTLMETPNARRDHKNRFGMKDIDDISRENVEDSIDHNRRSSYEAELEESGFADALLPDIEVPENRRINLVKTVISRPFNYEENRNSRKSHSSPLEHSNNRRKSNKGGSLANNKHIEMPYPERDGPDAYLDTVLILDGEGKPDDIAFAKPQLRNSKDSKIKDNDKKNRKKYEDSNLNPSSNDGVEREDQPLNKLLAVENSKSNRRSHKQVPNSNKNSKNRRDDNNLKLISKDRLNTDDDADDNRLVLSLADVNDLNLESQRRSNDQKPRSNRRDDDDTNPSVSPDDRMTPDDDNAVFDLSELLMDIEGFDDLQILPTLLRSNSLSNLNTDKNDYKLAVLDLSELEKVNAKDDLLGNLSFLRSLSVDNIDRESEVKIDDNKNPVLGRRVDDALGVELVLTDKLGPDNKEVEELVPYHESSLKKEKTSFNENDNRRKNNEEDLEIPSNNRRSHDDYDLSVLSLSGLDENKASFKNVEPLSPNKKDELTRRDMESKNNIDEIIAQIFGTKLDYVKNAKATNLRNADDEANGKNSILHLEYPWNASLSPDSKGIPKLVSNREPPSRLRTNYHSIARQDDSSNQNNYQLKLEYPWNGQQNPNKDDKAKTRSNDHSNNNQMPYFRRRDSNRRSYYDPLRVLPLKYGLRNDDLTLLDSFENVAETRPYLGHSNNFDDNQGLRVLSLARTNVDNDTDVSPNSLEDPSYITFPLDRRPHLRLMPKNNDAKKPVNNNRRAVETNTPAPKTDALTTIEGTTEKGPKSTAKSPSK